MTTSPLLDQTTATPSPTQPVVPRRRRKPAEAVRVVLVTVILLAFCLVWIYPFIWNVSASIKSPTEIFEGLNLVPDEIRLDNYVRAWTDGNIGRYFLNTLFVTFFSIIISVVSTALIGYVLGRYSFPGKKVVIGVFAFTVFVPEGYTIIPVFDLINRLGLDNSLWGITLAEAGGVGVVATLLFAGFFAQLPHELEEAARVDGAGFLRIFVLVYLPLAKPVTATAIILQFIASWNSFLLPLVLTLSNPELRTLAVGIYSFQGENVSDYGAIAAASTIALVPIIVVFLFLQRYFVESVAGAMKG